MDRFEIMIAEPDCLVAEDLRQTLIRHGYSVVESVRHAGDVVKTFLRRNPDLLLMETSLTVWFGGLETFEKIRIFYGMPVVYLTTMSHAHAEMLTLELGTFSFVPKPFCEANLCRAIQKELNESPIPLENLQAVSFAVPRRSRKRS